MLPPGIGQTKIFQPWKLGTCVQYYRSDLLSSSSGSVDTWNDRTSNALNLTQTGSLRPTLNTTDADYGGHPSLSITGSQYMDAGIQHISQIYTIHAIGKCSDASAVRGLIDDVTGSAGFRAVIQASTTNTRLFAGSIATIAADLTSAFWIVAEFNTTSSKLWKNGALITSGASVGTQGVGQVRFGASPSADTFWRGTCAEFGIWSGSWSAANFSTMQRYIKSQYYNNIISGL